jgi:hypothetical protein
MVREQPPSIVAAAQGIHALFTSLPSVGGLLSMTKGSQDALLECCPSADLGLRLVD